MDDLIPTAGLEDLNPRREMKGKNWRECGCFPMFFWGGIPSGKLTAKAHENHHVSW